MHLIDTHVYQRALPSSYSKNVLKPVNIGHNRVIKYITFSDKRNKATPYFVKLRILAEYKTELRIFI